MHDGFEFYVCFEKEDAARVYLRKLQDFYPGTPEGRRAEEILEDLGSR